MRNPFTTGERLYLRPLEPEDAPLLAACNNDPAVRVSFFTHTPVSVHACEQKIRGLYGAGADYLPLAICLIEDNSAIGITAWHRLDLVSRAAVFAICIADSTQWGRGFAGEATRLMLAYGFDVLNLHRVHLHVWAGNEAALRTYEKCGFVLEGTLRQAMMHNGQWCDFHVMGLLEDEWRRGSGKRKEES